ncbi:malectin domain-containing carbohydrate-binding protein [Hymenobacter sp. H14-R3]|uniref:malectin domain-containing carbohydrate-binding protein n=1 Tax=Hymenobacter sp. H14-R3 TaxID=3046308 RepID=UPI0024B9F1D4|nr:malectin domain-containing carbohydrate-binding protein [Hymenobacter sp. H14-R3]MDJ0367390.1 malectin domain-containing carbohydrate-binding protein [Hymenobacter sp. H14-R3]
MPNPANLLDYTAQDERIPELPLLPAGTDRATLSLAVFNPATNRTEQTPLVAGDAATTSNQVVGGPKFVRYRSSQLYGVPAGALTLDRLSPATIVPNTEATVQNPADAPLSLTELPRRYVATLVPAGTAGAVLVPAYVGAPASNKVPIVWVLQQGTTPMGPNYLPSGLLSVIYLTQDEATRAGHPEYATLEGLDPTYFYNGMVCRVDLHPAGFGIEMQLTYDDRPDARAGLLAYVDGSLQLYPKAQVDGKNAVKWTRKDSTETRTANVPLYSPTHNQYGVPPGYRVDDLMKYVFGATITFQALLPGQLPPPALATGDANWAVFVPPAPENAFVEARTVGQMQDMARGSEYKAGRLYHIIQRADAQLGYAIDDMRIRALTTSALEPTGWLMQDPSVLVNYDLATDATTPVSNGGNGYTDEQARAANAPLLAEKADKTYVDNAVQLPGVLVRQNVVVNALAPVIYTGASLADAGDALTAKGGGGVYAFIDIYRQPAILARNITLPTGTVVNGNNYIIRLDGKTISYNQAGRFFNFAAESGTMQCKFPSDQNPTEFVGGRFGSVLHIAPPNALVLHTNVLYNDAPDFVRFSGGGTFLLNGISADPLPGQIAADGTTVRRSDSVAGPAGKWPPFTNPVSDLGSQLYKATAPQYIRTADVRYTTNGGASYSAAVAAQRAGDVFSLAAPAGSPIGQLGWQVGPGYGRAPSDTLFNAVAFALPDVLRFYAGAETHIDVNGKSWQPLPASQPRFDYNGAGYPPLATVDAELYNIVFYTGSDFSINLPVANGNYRLGLVFSEPYGPLRGARTFDVRLDASGPLILANVNTYTAGSNIASYASQAIISATGGNGITLSLASTGSGPPILQCITLTTA